MIELTVLGTSGEEFGYGACPTAMTFREQAEMLQELCHLRFAEEVQVSYRSLEDGLDPELAGRVRRGEIELPLVLLDGRLLLDGGVPWRDIEQEIRQVLAVG